LSNAANQEDPMVFNAALEVIEKILRQDKETFDEARNEIHIQIKK
jgi:hypothetical protein